MREAVCASNQWRDQQLAASKARACSISVLGPSGGAFSLAFSGWQAGATMCGAVGRERIVVERGSGFTQPAQQAFPLGAKLIFQLLTKTLCERRTVASSRDRDLQRTTPHHGRIVKVAISAVRHNITQYAAQTNRFVP